jgi:hypothetical protein
MKAEYMGFDSRSKEAFNTAQLGAVLARKEEYLLPLRFDSNGADVLAYNPATNRTRAIQIKARATVEGKYRGKELWIAFPHWVTDHQQDWYVVPHDRLEELWGKTRTWQKDAKFSANNPPKHLIAALLEYRVGSIALS